LINTVKNIVPGKFEDTDTKGGITEFQDYNNLSKSDDVIMSASGDSDRLSCLGDSDDQIKPQTQAPP
jgi:hypothetical protein